MKETIVNRINELKFFTENNIKTLSRGNVPYRANLNLVEKYSYRLDGKDHNPPVEFSKVFISQQLPYTDIATSNPDTYEMPFANAVSSKEIYPILLFINGKFIKWSDITLVKDYFYSYLIIKNMDGIGEKYQLDTIVVPEADNVYTENVTTPTPNCIFFFDSNTDLYSSVPSAGKMYTTLALNNSPDIISYKNTLYSNKRFNIPLQYNVELQSLFVFKNGLFYKPDEIEEYTLNVFNVVDTESVYVSISSFAYRDGNPIKDNETCIVNKDLATNKLLSKQNQKFFDDISERFNFDFTTKDSETNMSNSLRYIMDYNPILMNQIYKDKSNIISKIFTGNDLTKALQTDGFVHLSRKLYKNYDCYLIVFKNGYLYDGYRSAIYKNNEFIFRIDGTISTDIFEVLYLTNIDNGLMSIRLWSGEDDIIDLDPSIDINNMILASPSPHTHLYNHERNDSIVYNVEFDAIRVSEGKVDLRLKDSYYYDKLLYLGSKNQFRYFCKYNNESESITEIQLPDEFKMCTNRSCYMIFINGLYIDPSSYDITIYDREDPFYRIGVYFDKQILSNDRVEVLYIGNILTKVYDNTEKINNSGNILLDSNKLKYPFDYELYMIFIDGRKSLPSEIVNVDSNRLSIATTSSNIINKVAIIQFVEEDEILYAVFKDNTDLLSTIVGKMSDEDLKTMFSKGAIQTDFVDEKLNLDDRMLRIVRDYWMKAYINNGDEMPISFNNYYSDNQIIDTGNLSDD